MTYKAGDKVGQWTVLERATVKDATGKRSRTHYICRCTCGTERKVYASNLEWGRSLSCGHDRDKLHGRFLRETFQNRKGHDPGAPARAVS